MFVICQRNVLRCFKYLIAAVKLVRVPAIDLAQLPIKVGVHRLPSTTGHYAYGTGYGS